MKIKLFTHTDLDGISCAILGILAFGKENMDIEYCDYNDINEKVKEFVNNKEYNNYDHVYITDISINDNLAEYITNYHPKSFKNGFNLAETFTLLDHHPTALELNKYWWCNVEEETILLHQNNEPTIIEKVSGTYLFFMELLSNDFLNVSFDEYLVIREFCDIVRKYDTWIWKTKYNDIKPKQWNDLFYILGRDRFIDHVLELLQLNQDFSMSANDIVLLELEQEKIDKYIESKNEQIIVKDIQGYKAGIVFGEQYHSELGNKLAELHPELDFIVIINMAKAISYRGVKDDIDLSKIAKVYGGGGHKLASGSPINDEAKNKLLDLLFA